jgi:hypothetical protein
LTSNVEPDDILYENLGVSYWNRFIRKHIIADGISLVYAN